MQFPAIAKGSVYSPDTLYQFCLNRVNDHMWSINRPISEILDYCTDNQEIPKVCIRDLENSERAHRCLRVSPPSDYSGFANDDDCYCDFWNDQARSNDYDYLNDLSSELCERSIRVREWRAQREELATIINITKILFIIFILKHIQN